jgi:hypothetical protein
MHESLGKMHAQRYARSDMNPPPIQHPPPIRRADRRNAPKGAQRQGLDIMQSRNVCTVRSKHEIYGDERTKLTNNKSKGSKAQLQGIPQSRGFSRVAFTPRHRTLCFTMEIDVETFCFCKKLCARYVVVLEFL